MATATLELERVTPNVFTTTKLRGCNPSFVVTSGGGRLHRHAAAADEGRRDARRRPSRTARSATSSTPRTTSTTSSATTGTEAPARWSTTRRCTTSSWTRMRRSTRSRTRSKPSRPTTPTAPRSSPTATTTTPTCRAGTVVFTGDLTLRVGGHTIRCLWTPGHTPGQLAVHVPEERVVFTGDTIFSGCQTWLMTSNVDQWLEALERIRALEDVDYVVPGHGPVVDLKYVETQRAVLMTWKAAVADAVARGLSREETIATRPVRQQVRPRRRRTGLHDGSHPEQQRRLALGQAHRDGLRQGPLTPDVE